MGTSQERLINISFPKKKKTLTDTDNLLYQRQLGIPKASK